ncbi:hypothetical protein B0H17DRAFT_1142490 [Mycena rosella]|uniref:Uncharacterized protein n=1 Tax=Mycena rosella TaxID=1033263 RepID=A0AAD7G8Y9_MYCRO|nr:hypothetical protein B0H17DRAFT_1142490 [Mycena rosella]
MSDNQASSGTPRAHAASRAVAWANTSVRAPGTEASVASQNSGSAERPRRRLLAQDFSRRHLGTNPDRYTEPEHVLHSDGEPEVDLAAFPSDSASRTTQRSARAGEGCCRADLGSEDAFSWQIQGKPAPSYAEAPPLPLPDGSLLPPNDPNDARATRFDFKRTAQLKLAPVRTRQ